MRLLPEERGMLLSPSMSDASVASIFGKPERWATKARAWLRVEAERDQASWKKLGAKAEAKPAKRQPAADLSTVRAVVNQPPQPQAPSNPVAKRDAPSACPNGGACHTPGACAHRGHCGARAVPGGELIPARSIETPASGFPKPAPSGKSDAEIPARVLRWARWFVAADWRVAEVATLFDVPADALRAQLAPQQRAA